MKFQSKPFPIFKPITNATPVALMCMGPTIVKCLKYIRIILEIVWFSPLESKNHFDHSTITFVYFYSLLPQKVGGCINHINVFPGILFSTIQEYFHVFLLFVTSYLEWVQVPPLNSSLQVEILSDLPFGTGSQQNFLFC